MLFFAIHSELRKDSKTTRRIRHYFYVDNSQTYALITPAAELPLHPPKIVCWHVWTRWLSGCRSIVRVCESNKVTVDALPADNWMCRQLPSWSADHSSAISQEPRWAFVCMWTRLSVTTSTQSYTLDRLQSVCDECCYKDAMRCWKIISCIRWRTDNQWRVSIGCQFFSACVSSCAMTMYKAMHALAPACLNCVNLTIATSELGHLFVVTLRFRGRKRNLENGHLLLLDR